MLKPFRKLVKYTSSQKGAKVTILAWILAVVLLSLLVPSAKEYEVNSTEGSINGNKPSEIAQQILKEQFPSTDGLPALLVFHREGGISEEDIGKINKLSEWLASDKKPEQIMSALPFHALPPNVQKHWTPYRQTTRSISSRFMIFVFYPLLCFQLSFLLLAGLFVMIPAISKGLKLTQPLFLQFLQFFLLIVIRIILLFQNL